MVRASREVNWKANAALLLVALGFYGQHLTTQSHLVIQPERLGIALENGNLNLGHVQPTAMDGACNGIPSVAECDDAHAGGNVS